MSRVLARKAIVKTAKDFAITGSAACPAVKFTDRFLFYGEFFPDTDNA